MEMSCRLCGLKGNRRAQRSSPGRLYSLRPPWYSRSPPAPLVLPGIVDGTRSGSAGNVVSLRASTRRSTRQRAQLLQNAQMIPV